ncbi:MAG: PA14 domain-containing protein [Gemmataceae bacterium]|nr:PA14 domain-containing protein [Gemmataceae bacterium]
MVPSFERFFTERGADLVAGGRLLLAELNCVACHKSEDQSLKSKAAPVLTDVGGRVKRSYLRQFLADPQGVKNGTTMPDLLAGLPPAERAEKVEALFHFLASTGTPRTERPERKWIGAGRDLYHQVGCLACHETRDAAGNIAAVLPTSVPIATSKYTLGSLRAFLENPLAVRPSGRMPGLLNSKEAQQVANYLLQGEALGAPAYNMSYAYYEGEWDKLPDFARLKPKATGQTADFDLSVARRSHNMALKFDGFLKIAKEGQYKFWLTSDDGSKLWIGGKLVVNNDGVHAPTTVTGAVFLSKGMHPLTAAVFNAGGGVELAIDIQGQGLGRQSVAPFVYLSDQGETVRPATAKHDGESLEIQPALAAKGREYFATLGCANCHELKENGKTIASKLMAQPLGKLAPAGGCLAEAVKSGLPKYPLSAAQRAALQSAVRGPAAAASDAKSAIARSLLTFNCYACHERDKVGGPEEARNKSFTTAQPEMGDEARIPPSLNGVGAKLRPEYLRKILHQGAHDRPYMHTRMPGFGEANVGHLVRLFVDVDHLEPAPKVVFEESPAKVKAAGRHLVGAQAFACYKCHTFNGQKAEGVQGIDMTLMPVRLQRDWFIHYVLDPNRFRPGTRMPTAWPKGEVTLPNILGGKAINQIEGIWLYLSDGPKAQIPVGMKPSAILLQPIGEAIIYRAFIQGAGPRGIGVGFPERVNLAFDANNLSLAMIWQGAFIDASRHWTGRGEGFEPPLGDNILHLPQGVNFAVLAKPDDPWPAKSARELGYRFRGYKLTPDQRPTFLYEVHGVRVADTPNGIAGKEAPIIRRALELEGAADNLYFRAAVGDTIEALGDGWYRVGEWKMRLAVDGEPRLRSAGGRWELLVPVRFESGRARIVQEYHW